MTTLGKISQRERERRALFMKADSQLRQQINQAFTVVEADIQAQKAAHEAHLAAYAAFVGRTWRERLRWLLTGR